MQPELFSPALMRRLRGKDFRYHCGSSHSPTLLERYHHLPFRDGITSRKGWCKLTLPQPFPMPSISTVLEHLLRMAGHLRPLALSSTESQTHEEPSYWRMHNPNHQTSATQTQPNRTQHFTHFHMNIIPISYQESQSLVSSSTTLLQRC